MTLRSTCHATNCIMHRETWRPCWRSFQRCGVRTWGRQPSGGSWNHCSSRHISVDQKKVVHGACCYCQLTRLPKQICCRWCWKCFAEHLIESCQLDYLGTCRNPSLGSRPRQGGLQGCGPISRPGSAKSVREWTLTLPSELPCWELESQNFRERFEGSKLHGWLRSLYQWKGVEV